MYTTTSSFLFTLLAGSSYYATSVQAVPTPQFTPPTSNILPITHVKTSFAFPAAAAKVAARAISNPKHSARDLAAQVFPVAAKKTKRQIMKRAAEAASNPSITQQIANLFDKHNRWFPATIAVTCVSGFIICLVLIYILQKIAHMKRFADPEDQPFVEEKTTIFPHSRAASGKHLPSYDMPVVPELRVSTSPDVRSMDEKKRFSRELLLPPGQYQLPRYSEEPQYVNRPAPAVRSPRRHRSITPSYRPGRSSRNKKGQAQLGVGQPQGRKSYARVITQ